MTQDKEQTHATEPELSEVQEAEEAEASIPELLDEAKRNFALRKWDAAVDGYGLLLEALSDKHPEEPDFFGPLHHRYGHALLEHAIATSGALGDGGGKDAPMPSKQGGASTVASARAQEKDKMADKKAEQALAQAVQNAASSSSGSASGSAVVGAAAASAKDNDPRFTFGGDAEDSDDEEDGAQGAGAPSDDEEREDDLGVAFTVLELARVRYEEILENGSRATLKTIDDEEWGEKTLKLQLAEVYNDLADVGLESENFQQASSDYKKALELLEQLLWSHSRRLADANLRLGLALEFHPDSEMQRSAETYVLAALNTLRRRLDKLDEREKHVENGGANAASKESTATKADLEADDVAAMDWQAVAKEKRDVQDMIKELEMKLDEYKSGVASGNGAESSNGGQAGTAGQDPKAALKQAINEALLGASTNGIAGAAQEEAGFSASAPGAPVNDLSAMVKKKKRPAPDEGEGPDAKGKGKASASVSTLNGEEKRART